MAMTTKTLGTVFVLLVILAGVLAAPAFADEGESADTMPAVNKMCPVTTEEPVDPNYWVMHEGRKIGFCCKRCKTQFRADAGSFLENLPPVESAPIEHGSADHDHSIDHDAAVARPRLLVIVGRMHVMAVHFPVALLMLAALLELASLRGQWRGAAALVRPFAGLGALSSIAAASLGLIHALDADYRGELLGYFEWHRALGLATVAGSVLAWYLIEKRRRDPTHKRVRAARIVIVMLGILVGVAGHLGGALVFGPDYLIP